MTIERQIKLAESSRGRVTLHTLAFIQDRKLWWHLKGIIREFKG